MKNFLSFIRWKFVIPTAIFVAAILVFFIIFFDPLLAKGIEWGGSKINGAKVDVSGLHTKLFQGRLSIANLQVTDKESTMKNVVEAGPLAFQIDFSEIISKRVIIPEASSEGLRFNTDRKSDGKLLFPPKKMSDGKPSVASKLTEKYQERFKLQLGDMKTDAKAKVDIDPKELALTKQAEGLKTKATALPDDWKKKVDGLNVEERLKKAEADLKEIENTPTKGTEAITAIPASLKKLKQVKSDLDQIKTDLKSTRDGLSGDLKDLKSGIAGLQDAKKKDLDDLMSRLNLDFANPKRLIEGMVGGALLGKVKTGLHYIQLARSYMPSKKEEDELPPKPRATGIDIPFSTPAALPRFWLKKGSLSGLYEDVSASGVMTNLTSSPSRVGKPFIAEFKGAKGINQFLGEIVADHVTDISKDSLLVQGKNLKVSGLINDGELAKAIKEGLGDIEMALTVTGADTIGGHVRLALHGLKLDESIFLSQFGISAADAGNREEAIKVQFMKGIARGFESMPSVNITAALSGTWGDPDMKLSSNLDDMVKKAVKDSFGSVVDTQRKELEAKLDSILASHKSELDQKTAGLQGKLNDLLGGMDTKVQEKINKATKINLGGSEGGSSGLPIKIPSLDKLFKK